MNQEQLSGYIGQLKISADQILREEAEMVFLNDLANNAIGSKIIFYGGTVLRLAYGSPRFSEDIDLIQIKQIEFGEFKKFIAKTALSNNWLVKDIKNKRQTMFALFLLSDSKLKHNFSLKIEIHKPAKKADLDQKLMLIKSPVSFLEPLLLAPSLEKLKELKLAAWRGRNKARDIFDLWYIASLLREPFTLPAGHRKFSKREFKNELQVFLPKKYYPVIDDIYGQINKTN